MNHIYNLSLALVGMLLWDSLWIFLVLPIRRDPQTELLVGLCGLRFALSFSFTIFILLVLGAAWLLA